MVKAAFLGRFCPITIGHEYIINQMLKEYNENCLIILGSIDSPLTTRNIFSYKERYYFIQKVFPEIQITGLPDYDHDEKWLKHLDQILHCYGGSLYQTLFYIGCKNDAEFFHNAGVKTKTIDRFNGTSPKISATSVRNALFNNIDISNMVNQTIQEDVKRLFLKNKKRSEILYEL